VKNRCSDKEYYYSDFNSNVRFRGAPTKRFTAIDLQLPIDIVRLTTIIDELREKKKHSKFRVFGLSNLKIQTFSHKCTKNLFYSVFRADFEKLTHFRREGLIYAEMCKSEFLKNTGNIRNYIKSLLKKI